MKKILSLILAVSLLAGIGIAVRASSITEDTPEATQSVQAVYQTEGETPAVIRVDIAWTGMSFTYNGPSQPQWDAENHKYVSSEGYWSPSNAAITITNHSNAIIQADIGYRALDAFSDTSQTILRLSVLQIPARPAPANPALLPLKRFPAVPCLTKPPPSPASELSPSGSAPIWEAIPISRPSKRFSKTMKN